MSWGSLFGAFMNTIAFAFLWTILGKVIEVITKAFNHAITVIPTFQDAVTGFNMMQWGWSGVMVIILLGIWLNYVANSSATSNQEV